MKNFSLPCTLPDLLLERSLSSTAGISFLDNDGFIAFTTTYTSLYRDAQDYARSLLISGIEPNGINVVIASFDYHYDHILLFWACIFGKDILRYEKHRLTITIRPAGIPVCPIPTLHPEESQRKLFLGHLLALFGKPVFVGKDDVIATVQSLVPSFETRSWTSLKSLALVQSTTQPFIYPKFRPQCNDIVCFMLTSGSTGNSKAVGLRHSNFLSAVQGKIKHHVSTHSSRFLNWIAFDHVACVSEVHLQALMADAW